MYHKKTIGTELREWGKSFTFAIFAAIAINNTLIVNAKIPSGSMETTIMTGDRVIANRLAYLNKTPERFDVIVFKYPDDESQNFVKRIIGMPGETVEIIGGQVYINNSQLDDSMYTSEAPVGDFGKVTVPPFHYFVLGDNRNNSHDSKNWKNPFVDEHKILGKVKLQYFPHVKALH